MNESNKKLYIFLATLLTLSAFSTAIFGVKVLYMLLVSIGIAFLFEFIFAKVKKQKTNFLEWLVTPILFVMFLPVSVPLWLVLWGSLFGVLFGKLLFGGAGKYVFSPALVGILFVTISFPQLMIDPNASASLLKTGGFIGKYKDLLMGNSVGALGEVFRLLIIFLGIILIAYKVIDWKIPVFYIISLFLFTAFANQVGMKNVADPIDSLLVGSLLLGAFFAATDDATIAKYPVGRVIYGVGLGFFTFIIRNFSAYQEGVVFAIIIMNMLAPLIDKIEEPRPVKNIIVDVSEETV